ncbi:LOW QUALITY PROTEIN: hypothetical protein KIPB_001634 [Kipferlia bialata]|uniref:Uncharacterized protein n=1 Tax=Kipferlia bialata TaxID=797122 RepID=A0A9K3CQV2_9EUKA|nr:LOW QUALITY PROTEIN: hypothetical protein KIPB_001634 [Kipferlia bialata]
MYTDLFLSSRYTHQCVRSHYWQLVCMLTGSTPGLQTPKLRPQVCSDMDFPTLLASVAASACFVLVANAVEWILAETTREREATKVDQDYEFARVCALPYDSKKTHLEFPYGLIDMSNSIKKGVTKVYIRKCYGPLFKRVVKESKMFDKTSSPVPVFITGTPGCGKTFFRVYSCWRLLNHIRDKQLRGRVLFQKGTTNGKDVPVTIISLDARPDATCTDVTVRRVGAGSHQPLSALVEGWQSEGDLVVSLTDVAYGKYTEVPAFCNHNWYFTSPHKLIVCNTTKNKMDGVNLYMGLWTLAEIKRAVRNLGLRVVPVRGRRGEMSYSDPESMTDSQILEHRFRLFGGTARAVLDKPAVVSLAIDQALVRLSTDTTVLMDMIYEGGESLLAAQYSDSLFHIEADGDFLPSYHWATPAIRAKAARIAVTNQLSRVRSILYDQDIPHPQSPSGLILEELWFQWFLLLSCGDSRHPMFSVKEIGRYRTSCSGPYPSAPTPDSVYETLQDISLTAPIKRLWYPLAHMKRKLKEPLKAMIAGDTSPVLLRPHEPNISALEGVLLLHVDSKPCVLFLRCTVRAEHSTPFNPSLFSDTLLDVVPRDVPCAFVFILPPNRYVDWSVQSIVSRQPAGSILQMALCPGLTEQDTVKYGKRPRTVDVGDGAPVQGSPKGLVAPET